MIPINGRKIPAVDPDMQDDAFENQHRIDALEERDYFSPFDSRCVRIETFESEPELSLSSRFNAEELINSIGLD